MRRVRVWAASGPVLGDAVLVADRWWSRLRGLLGRPPLRAGEGLLLTPCRGIHLWGMPYPLDVLLLDRGGRVIALYRRLPPGGRTRVHRAGRVAIELPAGTLDHAGTALGDRVAWAAAGEGDGAR